MRTKVTNHYFENCETNHRSIKTAIKSAATREGEGWYVIALIDDVWQTVLDHFDDYFYHDDKGELIKITD